LQFSPTKPTPSISSLPPLPSSAGVSHQLRDSIRRGLWLCPLGSTAKLPYGLYLTLLGALPLLIRAGLAKVGGMPALHRSDSFFFNDSDSESGLEFV
jgi:hypothetical protein